MESVSSAVKTGRQPMIFNKESGLMHAGGIISGNQSALLT
jgi:hypothetical protein